MSTPLDRLKSQLLTSGIQQENSALFQVINQLIDYLRGNVVNVQNIFGGGGGGGVGLLGASYLTKYKEVGLPNSLQALAGSGIQFNDSLGRRIISAAMPFDVAEEALEGQQGIPGLIGPRGFQGLSGRPGLDGEDGEESIYSLLGIQGVQASSSSGSTSLIGPRGNPGIDGLDGEDCSPNLLGILGIVSSLSSSPITVVTTAVNYSILPTDNIIIATAALTLTLPPVGGLTGRKYYIKHMAVDGLEVTVQGSGGSTIDDSATQIISAKYTAMEVAPDGTNWIIL